MTQKEELLQRLFGDPNRKALNFNIFPGDDINKYTVEEICREINKAMKQLCSENTEIYANFPDNPKGTKLVNVLKLEKRRYNESHKMAKY